MVMRGGIAGLVARTALVAALVVAGRPLRAQTAWDEAPLHRVVAVPAERPLESSTLSRGEALGIGALQSLIMGASVLFALFGLAPRRDTTPPEE